MAQGIQKQIGKARNGVRHDVALREHARVLRREGKTHREIRQHLGISLGSAWLWTLGITLTLDQKKDIQIRRNLTTFTPERRKKIREYARKNLAPYQYKKKFTDEDLLGTIRKFTILYGRIPLKREIGNRRIFRQRFGTWNNAIQLAGFEPHRVLFAEKVFARDGHRCDSLSERIIDDWLFDHGIPHEREVRYGSTRMRSDFSIFQNTVIEFFGLAGIQHKYDQLIEKKKRICKKLNLRLIALYPDDIFPDRRLHECLDAIIKHPHRSAVRY